MSTRTAPKTPYEIRLELLQLAQTVLENQHIAKAGGFPSGKTSPTTEEIIVEAEKMNNFISKANQSSH